MDVTSDALEAVAQRTAQMATVECNRLLETGAAQRSDKVVELRLPILHPMAWQLADRVEKLLREEYPAAIVSIYDLYEDGDVRKSCLFAIFMSPIKSDF